ncbi:hypothetical protein G6M16_024450 (plasmid) [Agrobacterium tumefaciens]|uniref:hypothetical protein n=1 Tax=Agrobacterium tumefaciens TaxID=358 RepID=UPI0015719308|nr:hypothetical protein [Agrobacterium tumefaciens]WCA62397.1 hypothetical protein G6M16_024450 [Agrobacterium tumefaciens]
MARSKTRQKNGHPPRGTSGFFSLQRLPFQNNSNRSHERFGGGRDWRRLIALGTIVVNLSALGLLSSSFGRPMPDYWPGMPAIFSGLVIAIIIMRIGRPKIYWDWVSLGALEITLGVLLKNDPVLASALYALPFYGLLAMSAVQLGVIGASIKPNKAWTWLGAGGAANIIVTTLGCIDHFTSKSISAETALMTTLMIIGLSLIGLGKSLRPKRDTGSIG